MGTVTLTTEIVTDYLVEHTGRVFVIERTRYLDGETLVSEHLHRRPIEPDADVSEEAADVRAVAELSRSRRR